jgi:hypothetical protein
MDCWDDCSDCGHAVIFGLNNGLLPLLLLTLAHLGTCFRFNDDPQLRRLSTRRLVSSRLILTGSVIVAIAVAVVVDIKTFCSVAG